MFADTPFRGALLLTHLHWDHTQGLPFFPPADNPGAAVELFAPGESDVAGALERMMSPPNFPITPSQLRGEWHFKNLEEGAHEIQGYSVLAKLVPHKGGQTFGYRISDGLTSLAYVSDH